MTFCTRIRFLQRPLAYEEILDECNVHSRSTNLQKAGSSRLVCSKSKSTWRRWGLYFSSKAVTRKFATLLEISLLEKINIQSFLALIRYSIDRGSTLSSSKEEPKSCEAAKLYFAVICIPRSMAFGVIIKCFLQKHCATHPTVCTDP